MPTYITNSYKAKNRFYVIIVFILSFGFFNNFYNDVFFLTNWAHNYNRYREKIPEKLLNKSQKYDVYPFLTSICYFNGLDYYPRPVFQSYFSYTPTLDTLNANFITKKKVDNIIFHTVTNNSPWGNTIDGRYFLFDEPLTKMEILKNYAIKDSISSSLFIAEKRKNDISIKTKLIEKKKCVLDSVISLASLDTAKLYFFTANFKYSTKVKFTSILEKYPYISVELVTADNKIMKFNTVSDLLKHYCILNKYCSSYYDYFSLPESKEFKFLKNIKTIKFLSNKNGYLSNFEFNIFEASIK